MLDQPEPQELDQVSVSKQEPLQQVLRLLADRVWEVPGFAQQPPE